MEQDRIVARDVLMIKFAQGKLNMYVVLLQRYFCIKYV